MGSILQKSIYLFLLSILMCTNIAIIGCKHNGNVGRKEENNEVRIMILEKAKAALSPGKKFEKTASQMIEQMALQVSKGIDNANQVWKGDDKQPNEYYEAAMMIVNDIELNKHEWLTLGNVVRYLGPFSVMEIANSSPFDNSGNIPADKERIYVYYPKQKIRISICASGFLFSLMSYDSTNYSGKVPLYWPHDYSYAKELPIISGVFKSHEFRDLLIEQYRDIIGEKIKSEKMIQTSYRDGKEKIYDLSNAPIQYYLIDGLSESLATVYFRVKGDKTVYCRTWWKFDNKNWEMLSEDQVISVFRKGGEKQ